MNGIIARPYLNILLVLMILWSVCPSSSKPFHLQINLFNFFFAKLISLI